MIPIELRDSVVYAKNQPQYVPLPTLRKIDGDILIQWKLSWKERFKLFFNGILYHQVKTFNQPLQPILITVERPDNWDFHNYTMDSLSSYMKDLGDKL